MEIEEDYHELYTGPEFLIEVRYSQIISTYYILMMYSSGMPVLYIIGMLQMFATYWVDKLLCKQNFTKLFSLKIL